jgi:hypothetical protein
MKLSEAMSIIEKKESGYMIHFEKRIRNTLSADYFPDKHENENLIKSEYEAWKLAKRFANATDETYVNIYVIDNNFRPVSGYEKRKLKSH